MRVTGRVRCWVVVLLVGAGWVAAQEHPVALEKNFDAAGCAACHEDKTKGKSVHSAIQSGCPTCHVITTTAETTTIKLTAVKDQLCQTCHEPAKGESRHRPYTAGQCLFCHDPHTSDYPKQTRALAPALCQQCHAPRQVKKDDAQVAIFNQTMSVADFQKIPKTPPEMSHLFGGDPNRKIADPAHDGESMTCRSCHLPHTSQEKKLLRLDGNTQDFCANCHDKMRE